MLLKKACYFIYLNIKILSIEKKVIPINNKQIEENFLFEKDSKKIFNVDITNKFSSKFYFLIFNVTAIYLIYSLIIFFQLNLSSRVNDFNIKEYRDSYIKKNGEKATENFLIVYERAYYLYVFYILVLYYLMKNYLFNHENFMTYITQFLLSMILINSLIIFYMNPYTNFLTKNFTKTFDGNLVIFSILYINIMILLSEIIIYKTEKLFKNSTKKNKKEDYYIY